MGSAVITTITLSADAIKVNEEDSAPAPTSIIMVSGLFLTLPKFCIILCLSKSLKFKRWLIALPPDTNLSLSFVVFITSSNDLLPNTKSSNENLGFMPSRIWEFAIPKSASRSRVFLFCLVRAKERLTAIVVLPTPPFPEAIAIVVVIINPYYILISFIYCAKTSLLAKAIEPMIDLDPDRMPILQFNSPKIDSSSAFIFASSNFVSPITGKVSL